ncbi:MAG: hypothetical protein ACOVO5_12095 [Devosia sp.]|uniref:hypothetical protein n=1 Tax=Devosia sp. TaxID=1871048 RepID=UPI0037BF7A88
MPDTPTRFVDEALSAGRGVLALVVGDRKAPQYFDLSQRGLVGSFIALLAVTLLSVALPAFLPLGGADYSIARSAAISVLLFALQLGFAAIVLRQLKRMDGLQPYVIADNWASVYISLGQLVLTLGGVQGDFAFFALAILVLVVEINIARLIVTLSALQIAMFMVAQLVGVSIALLFISPLMPPIDAPVATVSSQPQ